MRYTCWVNIIFEWIFIRKLLLFFNPTKRRSIILALWSIDDNIEGKYLRCYTRVKLWKFLMFKMWTTRLWLYIGTHRNNNIMWGLSKSFGKICIIRDRYHSGASHNNNIVFDILHSIQRFVIYITALKIPKWKTVKVFILQFSQCLSDILNLYGCEYTYNRRNRSVFGKELFYFSKTLCLFERIMFKTLCINLSFDRTKTIIKNKKICVK